MLALNPTVVDAVWQSFVAYLPKRGHTNHPLGCHRPRISDRDCFEAILFRLATGCSWDVAGRLGKGGETTLRRRRDEWVAVGAFQHLLEEAINAFDKVIGLDLSEVSVDGSLHKAPMGGEGTGPNPTDRGKTGWKWSIATDTNGVPIGWVMEGANRNDSILLAPTLDDVKERCLLADIETLWLDRGYDSELTRTRLVERGITDVMIAKKRKRGSAAASKRQPMGLRRPVERTNSWLSNFGQMRRNTDRFTAHRLCNADLADVPVERTEVRQVTDIPTPVPTTTERRADSDCRSLGTPPRTCRIRLRHLHSADHIPGPGTGGNSAIAGLDGHSPDASAARRQCLQLQRIHGWVCSPDRDGAAPARHVRGVDSPRRPPTTAERGIGWAPPSVRGLRHRSVRGPDRLPVSPARDPRHLSIRPTIDRGDHTGAAIRLAAPLGPPHDRAPLPVSFEQWRGQLSTIGRLVRARGTNRLLVAGDFNANWGSRDSAASSTRA
jgi:transposase